MMLGLSVFIVLIVLSEVGLVLLGLRGAGRRAGLDAAALARLTRRVALGFAAWIALVLSLAGAGVLARFDAKPPPMFLVLGGAVLLLVGSTRGPGASRLLEHTPRAWPIALQTLRVPIELMLFGLYAAGRFPVHLTLEGRNLDMLVGLSAPVVAYLVHTRRLGPLPLLAWNVVSLGFLANIVGMAITTLPGPLHLAWPGVSNVVVTEVPFVLLPAVLVPMALFGHVLSLRQLRADAAAPTADADNKAVPPVPSPS